MEAASSALAATTEQALEQQEAPAQQEEKKEPTRILLIRHGINDYVKTHRLAGRTPGVHLNEEGIAQAQALAQRLANEKIAAIYTSPMERAQETAEPLAQRLNLALSLEPGVLETDCGEWTGGKIEELSKTDTWRQLQVYPSGVRLPGGESFTEIQARMVATLDALREKHAHQTIAVVSHADPIRLAIAFYAGSPLDMFQRFVVAPASITEIDFSDFRPSIIRVNDCAHVPPAPPPEAAATTEEAAPAHAEATGTNPAHDS
jgi:probable phosphoglycerate mutase